MGDLQWGRDLNDDHLLAVLEELSLFAGDGDDGLPVVPTACLRMLLVDCDKRTLAPDDALWKRDDLSPELCLVWNGQLRIGRTDADGREMLFRFVGSRGLVGITTSLARTRHAADVTADVETQVLLMKHERVMQLAMQCPQVAIRAVRHAAKLVADLSAKAEILNDGRAVRLIAWALVDRLGGASETVFSKADAGRLVRLDADTVSRCVRENFRGIVEWKRDGKVRVLDRQRLEDLTKKKHKKGKSLESSE